MPRRAYENEYPSVTEILNVLRKIGLEAWYKYNTIKFINEESAKGKLIGTQIHEAIQSYIETGVASVETEYDEEVTNALKSFMLFREEHPEIKLTLAEIPLTSLIHGFNGTIDAPCPPELNDWKTAKCKEKEKPEIYLEYKYQTAAYVHLWNEHHPDSLINKVNIVALAKDKVAYNLFTMEEYEINEHFHNAFLPCLKILTHQKRKNQYELQT